LISRHNIKPISYTYITNDKGDIKKLISRNSEDNENFLHNITVTPEEFNNPKLNILLFTNKKWFYNLTSTVIPDKVSNLLQMGGNFCLPAVFNKKLMVREFIKDLEGKGNDIRKGIFLSSIRNELLLPLQNFYEEKKCLERPNRNFFKKIINGYH